MGNVLTKYPVRKITLKQAGRSTLGGVDMWFDPIIGRLNRDERGEYLGNFGASDSILVVYKEGSYELTNFDLTNHYVSNEVLLVKKFDPKIAITALYYDGGQKQHFIKRFNIETSSMDKKFLFISDVKNSKLLLASTDKHPRLEISLPKTPQSDRVNTEYLIEELVDIRGWKAMGNKLPYDKFKEIRWLPSLPEQPEEIISEPIETDEPVTNTEQEPEEIVSADEISDAGNMTSGESSEDNVVSESQEVNIEDNVEARQSAIGDIKIAKSKKESKKGSDPKSQLGLFEQ